MSLEQLTRIRRHDDERGLRGLLSAGLDANSRVKGDTLLSFMCDRGSIKCVQALLEYKADPNLGDDYGICFFSSVYPIHRAIQYGNIACLKELLEHKADPVIATENEKTSILHYACLLGTRKCVKELLKYGVPVDILDEDGYSPLGVAVVFNLPPTVRQLLRSGADTKKMCPDASRVSVMASRVCLIKMIGRAENRLRQWQRVAILTMWIRANREHEYRYSVLSLVGEIMKYLY